MAECLLIGLSFEDFASFYWPVGALVEGCNAELCVLILWQCADLYHRFILRYQREFYHFIATGDPPTEALIGDDLNALMCAQRGGIVRIVQADP